ncbi:MAG: DUF1667 domain-containing protein [Lachnospiraceae bacterium]
MRELICIVCPNGCKMKVEKKEEQWIVSGNKCKRGQVFAVAEMTHPMRTICSTVKTSFPNIPVLPVRVSEDIPKELIFQVMQEINQVVIKEVVGKGEVVIPHVLGLTANVIVTSDLLKREYKKGNSNPNP